MGSVTTFITERPKFPRKHDADIIITLRRPHFSPQAPSHVGRLSLDDTPTLSCISTLGHCFRSGRIATFPQVTIVAEVG